MKTKRETWKGISVTVKRKNGKFVSWYKTKARTKIETWKGDRNVEVTRDVKGRFISWKEVGFFGVTLVTAFNTREGWRLSSFELWVRGLVLGGRHKEKFFVELCGELDDEFTNAADFGWLYNISKIDPKEGVLLGNYWGVEEEPSTFDYERLGVKVSVYRTGGGMYEEVKSCRTSLRLIWIGGLLKIG